MNKEQQHQDTPNHCQQLRKFPLIKTTLATVIYQCAKSQHQDMPVYIAIDSENIIKDLQHYAGLQLEWWEKHLSPYFVTEITLANFAYRDVVSLLIYELNFGIYSSCRAKPELIRSAGGWRAIRAAYKAGIRLTSDERILGSSSFVEKTLASAGEDYDRRMRLKASGIDLEVVMDVVCAHLGVNTAELSGPSRRQQICQARALISYLAVGELRISGADVARRMNIDRSSVSRAVGRVQADPALKNMCKALLDHLYPQG